MSSQPLSDKPDVPATALPSDVDDRAMVWAFLGKYAWRYRWQYLAGLGFLLATNVLTVAIPRLQKDVFDELSGLRRSEIVHHNALAIAAAAVLVIVVRTLSRVLFFNPGRTIEFRVRNDMLARLLSMSPSFFGRWSIGDLMSRATDDATYVRALVGFSAIMVLNIVLAASMALVQMVQTDAWLTFYCVLPLFGAVWLLRKGVRWAMSMMRDAQKTLGALSDVVLETYKGIAVVQGAAVEASFVQRFDRVSDEFTRLNLRQAAVRTFLMPIVGAVGNLCIFLLLFVGGQHVVERRMTLGDLAAYASYIGVLVGALASAGWVVGVLQRGAVSLRRVWDVTELRSDLVQGDRRLLAQDRGVALRVQHLTWGWSADAQEQPVLRDLQFAVEPGQVLGIYGAVGSGKSTLVSLLSRLSAPPPGTIFVDGVDLCDVDDQDLRRAVAVVPQEAFLFSRSIRENIGFIDPRQAIDDVRVAAAVQAAQLAPEVARMAQGLETVVGEKGLMLSGGQRQRVQLARAFYRGFRLLILDDVLSAVDNDTEERLLLTLRAQMADRGATAVIISHRLSALARADHILVLGDPAGPERGRIVQQGTHAQLLSQGGAYAQVWAAQQSGSAQPDSAAAVDTAAKSHAQPSGAQVA